MPGYLRHLEKGRRAKDVRRVDETGLDQGPLVDLTLQGNQMQNGGNARRNGPWIH